MPGADGKAAKEGGEKKEAEKKGEEAPKDPEEAKEEAKAAASDEGASSVLENKPKRKPSASEKKATVLSDALNV